MPLSDVATSPVFFMPAIAAKLRSDLSLGTSLVRIVDEKTIRGPLTEVLAEQGIALCLSRAAPSPTNPGAGRQAYKVRRTLWIRPVTVNSLDPVGRNELGLLEHWAFQDAILSSLVGQIVAPLILPIHLSNADPGQWDLREDVGRYTSVLQLDVEYALPLVTGCTDLIPEGGS